MVQQSIIIIESIVSSILILYSKPNFVNIRFGKKNNLKINSIQVEQ
jgi:hypothetical protein